MTIYPTRTAAHLAIAGVITFALGIVLREPWIVAWGGGVLVGVAFARAATLVSVMRIRNAGFEMLWGGTERSMRVVRGTTLRLEAEVRNRDTLSACFDNLRVVASPALEVKVRPRAGEVMATGSVRIEIEVKARRVGFHAIHSLALEVRGAPGVFEVPLTFANPFGVAVLPRSKGRPRAELAGGRSGHFAVSGQAARARGDGSEVFELRELSPGDSFRRIAWKASAKRNKLIVRELEREESDVVVLVLDASTELWAGPVGAAPLDFSIDAVLGLARHYLARGDKVGLRIVAGRVLATLSPSADRSQEGRIVTLLLERTGLFDYDRSGWDETELAAQVAEHMRPLEPSSVHDLRRGRFDRLAERAARLRAHAPFAHPAPLGHGPEDAELRRYAACFGLAMPPRHEPDRDRTTLTLLRLLTSMRSEKKDRPTVVHVVSPPPAPDRVLAMGQAVKRLQARRIELRWTNVAVDEGLLVAAPGVEDDGWVDNTAVATENRRPEPTLYDAVTDALTLRARAAQRTSEKALARLGVTLVRQSSTRTLGVMTRRSEDDARAVVERAPSA